MVMQYKLWSNNTSGDYSSCDVKDTRRTYIINLYGLYTIYAKQSMRL